MNPIQVVRETLGVTRTYLVPRVKLSITIMMPSSDGLNSTIVLYACVRMEVYDEWIEVWQSGKNFGQALGNAYASSVDQQPAIWRDFVVVVLLAINIHSPSPTRLPKLQKWCYRMWEWRGVDASEADYSRKWSSCATRYARAKYLFQCLDRARRVESTSASTWYT